MVNLDRNKLLLVAMLVAVRILNQSDYQLQFLDVTGKIYYIGPLTTSIITTKQWAKGLYLYRIVDSTGKNITSGKLLKF